MMSLTSAAGFGEGESYGDGAQSGYPGTIALGTDMSVTRHLRIVSPARPHLSQNQRDAVPLNTMAHCAECVQGPTHPLPFYVFRRRDARRVLLIKKRRCARAITVSTNEGRDVNAMLTTYNGFDHNQRMKAFRWLQREYAAGRRAPPTVCDACGQTEGEISAHSEDYSEPYGDHIGRYGLCYRCHMAIHTRFNSREAWEAYKLLISIGRIFHPIGKNFGRFSSENLRRKLKDVPYKQGPVRGRTALDELIV
jgi:hypothetical protein